MRRASAIVRGLIWYCVPPDGKAVATNSDDERESEPFGPIVSRSPAVVSTFSVGGSPRSLEISISKQSGSNCAASAASQLSPILLLQSRQRKPAAKGGGNQVLFRIGLCGDRFLTEDTRSYEAPLFFHERIDILGIGQGAISGNLVVSRCSALPCEASHPYTRQDGGP
jgi:hypothetical protein